MNKREATEELVETFSAIPQEWVKIIAEHEGDEFYGIMWGTMWIVNNSTDISKIKSLLRTVTEEEDEEFVGTQEVGDTGIYAFEIGEELVLGINGAGNDAYE